MNIEFGNCMTIVVGKEASATGHVIFAHNEDDMGRCSTRHCYVEPMTFAPGATVPAEEGFAKIPEAPRTLGYYRSGVRMFKGGISCADLFFNECGVAVASDSACGSKEDRRDNDTLFEGGIEYNLRRIVGERARTAKEGKDLLISLVKKWGYAFSGRIYTVADCDEAYLIQVVQGHHYLAAKLPDDAIAVLPNHYNMHSLHDVEGMEYSEDIISYAVERGWYNPETDGEFDFAKAYQVPETYQQPFNLLRQKYGSEIMLGRKWDIEREGTPFCFKAERKVSVEDVMHAMSTHYEELGGDTECFGPGESPHDTNVRRICIGPTVESVAIEFEQEPLFTTAWTAYGRPCQLPYLPVHPLCGSVDAIDRMDDPVLERMRHLQIVPGMMCYRHDGWQHLQDDEHLQDMVYSRVAEDAKELLSRLHKEYTERTKKAAASARTLWMQGKNDQARKLLHADDERIAEEAIREMDAFVRDVVRPVKVWTTQNVQDAEREGVIRVSFACEGTPVEQTLLFGMGGEQPDKQFRRPVEGSLQAGEESGTWTAAFEAECMRSLFTQEGIFDFTLGGQDTQKKPFAGMVLIKA